MVWAEEREPSGRGTRVGVVGPVCWPCRYPGGQEGQEELLLSGLGAAYGELLLGDGRNALARSSETMPAALLLEPCAPTSVLLLLLGQVRQPGRS